MTRASETPARAGLWAVWRGLQRRLEGGGVPGAQSEARELLTAVLGRHPALPGPAMTETQERRLEKLARERLRRVPLAYLLGEWTFDGLALEVTPEVLIPRPETEELLELAAAEKAGRLRVLDVGTGSGALALALARRLPEAEVTATDVSAGALAVARRNGDSAGFSDRVRWLRGDLFDPLAAGEAFDLIVANLPYVDRADLAGLEPEVRREPRAALDGGKGGLEIVERFVAGVGGHLAPGGAVFLEVGRGQTGRTAAFLAAARLGAVRIDKDMNGAERFVSARKGTAR